VSANEMPEECESCGHATTELIFSEERGVQVESGWLCNVCYSTYAGRAFHSPRGYEYGDKLMLIQTALCTNLIIEAVSKSGKAVVS